MVPLVLANAIGWTMPFVGLPLALAALYFGLVVEAAIVAGIYIALGALVTLTVVPKPLGADPRDVPHLTLCHPHGINTSAFIVLCAGDRKWNKRRRELFGPPHFLATRIITIFCEFFTAFLACRCSSPSRRSIHSLMRANKDIYLYPGGFIEAARHSFHKDVVDVGSRGAIKLALCHGYAIRVCFAFGERKTAYNMQGLWKVRIWLAKRGVPAVVPFLRLWAPAPRVAFSPSIQLPAIEHPTTEDVEHWHGEYVAALCALHAAFKGPGDVLVVHDETKARRAA
jgi:hypothetical protein